MKKELTKKIILTIGLAMLIGLAIYGIVNCVIHSIKAFETIQIMEEIAENISQPIVEKNTLAIIKYVIFSIGFICYWIILGYCIIKLWKKEICFFKFTYDDYKKLKQEKQEINKQKKLTKLKLKIDKINQENKK